MNTNSLVITKLIDFGLSSTQSKIYLYLLTQPALTVVNIARNLSLPRTTVYDDILKLVEKGLLERIIKFKSQEFKAHPISALEQLIKNEKAKVERLNKNYDFIKSQISTNLLRTTNTEVRYYHGVNGLRQMMWHTLSAEEETFGYSVYGRVEIVGKKFMRDFVQEFRNKKLVDRVIINPTERTLNIIKRDVKPNQHQNYPNDIRYLPKNQLYVSGDTTIYNQTFAIAFWQQGEVMGVEIENPEFVKTQKTIFEILWKMAKPISSLYNFSSIKGSFKTNKIYSKKLVRNAYLKDVIKGKI